MSANGRGSMRPQSRSPPFLLIGLLVALVILAANYWSLSSNNASLSNEVSDLQDQLRLLSAKNINAEKRNSKSAKDAIDLQKIVDTQGEELKKKSTEIEKLNADLMKANEEVHKITQDKQTIQDNLKSCEENNNGIQDEMGRIKENITYLQNVAHTDCSSVCVEKKKELLGNIEKFAGLEVLKTLQNNGVDILEFKEKVLNLPAQNQQSIQSAALNQSSKVDKENPQSLQQPANQQQANEQPANQQQINPPTNQEASNQLPANQIGPDAPNPADQKLQDDKKADEDKQGAGSDKDKAPQIPTKTPESEKDKNIQPVVPDVKETSNTTDAKKPETNNLQSGNPSLASAADSKAGSNNTNTGTLGKLGLPNYNQLHPPNHEEMNNLMKEAVKQSVQEAINKNKLVSTTQHPSPGNIQQDVADTVKNEKEAADGAKSYEEGNDNVDDKGLKGIDKDTEQNDKHGDGEEYEEEDEKEKALKFEKDVAKNEDSIDKLQQQMGN